MIDITGLRERYAGHPNILRYIELLLLNHAYPRLEWIDKEGPTALKKIGMSLDDIEELLGYLMTNRKGETDETG